MAHPDDYITYPEEGLLEEPDPFLPALPSLPPGLRYPPSEPPSLPPGLDPDPLPHRLPPGLVPSPEPPPVTYDTLPESLPERPLKVAQFPTFDRPELSWDRAVQQPNLAPYQHAGEDPPWGSYQPTPINPFDMRGGSPYQYLAEPPEDIAQAVKEKRGDGDKIFQKFIKLQEAGKHEAAEAELDRINKLVTLDDPREEARWLVPENAQQSIRDYLSPAVVDLGIPDVESRLRKTDHGIPKEFIDDWREEHPQDNPNSLSFDEYIARVAKGEVVPPAESYTSTTPTPAPTGTSTDPSPTFTAFASPGQAAKNVWDAMPEEWEDFADSRFYSGINDLFEWEKWPGIFGN